MGIEDGIGFLVLFSLLLYGGVILFITRGLCSLIKAQDDPIFTLPHNHNTSSALNHVSTSLPFVSLILPVRNEAGGIRRCLTGFCQQDYPVELLEIFVTDDFSEDYTVEISRNFQRDNPGINITVISGRELTGALPGKKSAIDRAVKRASGELILCTDADTFCTTHWVTAMARGFSGGRYAMILGPVTFINDKTIFQKIQSLEFMGLMGTTAGAVGAGYPVMCNGANIAYSRTAYLETGGFSNNLGYASGDDHFLMAAIIRKYGKRSVKFLLKEEAVVSTEPERSLVGFFNQRLRWVSKSRGYHEPAVIALALITYAVHFFLLLGIVTGIFFPALLALSLSLWLIKILIDYPLVWRMTRFFGRKDLLGYYFIAQFFQLFYVVGVGLLGNILDFRWKGRKKQGN